MCPRFVLDTDVLVAAFRSDLGASRQLLLAALNGEFELLVSVALALEYEAVLTRAEHLAICGLSREDMERVLDDVFSVAEQVQLAFHWRPQVTDPDDDMVLETAVNGDADAIVTFNIKDFATAATKFRCMVMRPYEALRMIGRSQL